MDNLFQHSAQQFYDRRESLENKLTQLMHLLDLVPDRKAMRARTDRQLWSTYDACLRQFIMLRSQWPELYTRMVYRLGLGREPSTEEIQVWTFGLALRDIDSTLCKCFGIN